MRASSDIKSLKAIYSHYEEKLLIIPCIVVVPLTILPLDYELFFPSVVAMALYSCAPEIEVCGA